MAVNGLKVQCSISESFTKNLTESPMSGSALSGNQLTASILSRFTNGVRIINGFTSFFSGYENVGTANQIDVNGFWIPDATNTTGKVADSFGYSSSYYIPSSSVAPTSSTMYDLTVEQTSYYKTRKDNFYWNGINFSSHTDVGLPDSGSPVYDYTTNSYPQTYSGSSATVLNYPTVNGYPTSFDPIDGTSSIWSLEPPPMYNQFFQGLQQDIHSRTNMVNGVFASSIGVYYIPLVGYVDVNLSNPIDLAVEYNRVKDNTIARGFPTAFTSSTGFGVSYNTLPSYYGDTITAASSASYNDALVSGSTNSYTAPLANINAYNGWTISNNFINPVSSVAGNITIKTAIGQSKVSGSGSPDQNYFIGLVTDSTHPQTWNVTGSLISFGGSHFARRIDFISSGVLTVNQVIGYNASISGGIDLPFPTDGPFPIINESGTGVYRKHYFAVIGQDPTSWCRNNGYQFATSSSL